MSALRKSLTALSGVVALLFAGVFFAVSPAGARVPVQARPAAVAPVEVAPHAATGYGGAPATVTVSITFNPDGSITLTLTIAGFQPGEVVIIYIRSTPVKIGSGTADAKGVLSTTATIPAGYSGSHTIEAVGQTSGVVASSALNLTNPNAGGGSGSGSGSSGSGSAAGSGSSGGSLSSTGVAVVGIGALGVVLLLGGGTLLIAGRRRRPSEA